MSARSIEFSKQSVRGFVEIRLSLNDFPSIGMCVCVCVCPWARQLAKQYYYYIREKMCERKRRRPLFCTALYWTVSSSLAGIVRLPLLPTRTLLWLDNFRSAIKPRVLDTTSTILVLVWSPEIADKVFFKIFISDIRMNISHLVYASKG